MPASDSIPGLNLSLAALLPTDIAVVQAWDPAPVDALLVQERAMVATASHKRVREFATGRWCARGALREHGVEGFALLADVQRAPVWPRGFVGSITHTDGFCAAAIGRSDAYAGIGVDAEIDGRVTRDLWSNLFTREEIAGLERCPEPQRASMATVLFSAKESFYKAQYAVTRAWLDFTAASVRIEGDRWHLKLVDTTNNLARLPRPILGGFAIQDPYVVTAIAIDAFEPERAPAG